MSISFVAAGTSVTGANPTVPVPAGIAANDLLIIFTTGTATPTTPTGWTQLAAQGTNRFITVLYKYAGASESSVPLTLAGSTSRCSMVAYRSTVGVAAFDLLASFNAGTSTSISTLAQTTRFANDFVLSYFTSSGGTATLTAPASTSVRFTNNTTSAINGAVLVDELKATAGATTTRTTSQSSSRAWSSVSISVRLPQTLYWVGGSNEWTPTSTAYWAATSGGSVSALSRLFTTRFDSVVVDDSSGGPSIELTSPTPLSVVSFNSAAASSGSVYGPGSLNITSSFASGGVFFNITGELTFTGTVSAAGGNLNCSVRIVSGTTTLTNVFANALTVTLTSGTLNLNGYNLTCGKFSSNNTNVRSIIFGTNNIVLQSYTTSDTFVDMGNLTNFTYTGTGGLIVTSLDMGTINVGSVAGGSAANALNLSFTSGGTNLTIATNSWLKNVDFTNFNGSLNDFTFKVAGSLQTASLYTFGLPGTISFVGTSTGNTISAQYENYFENMVFDGAGGSWIFQNAMFVTNSITLTRGQIDLNGIDHFCRSFSSNNSNVRGITFGSAYIRMNSLVTETIIDIANATNFTQSNIGGAGFYLEPFDPFSITHTFDIGSVGGASAANAPNVQVQLPSSGTDYTLEATAGSWFGNLLFSSVPGGTFNFSTITVAGDLISSLNWTTGDTVTFAATSTGKTVAVYYTANPAANYVFNGVGGGWTLDFSTPLNLSGDLTITNGSLAGIGQISCAGNLTIGSGATILYTGALTLNATSAKTITSSGKTLNNITFNGSGGSWQLQDAMSVSQIMTLNQGTLILNGYNAACQYFESTGFNNRSIEFGSNFIEVTYNNSSSSATVVSMPNASNFSNSGTGGLKLTGSLAAGRTVTVATTSGATPNGPNVWVSAGNVGTFVTLNGATSVRSLDFTGFSGQFTLQNQIRVHGSLTFSSAMTVTNSATNSTIEFRATTAGQTITCAGKFILNATFGGSSAGGVWTLQDAFNVSEVTIVNAGTINANNQNVRTNRFTLSAGTINMGSGTWNIGTTSSTQQPIWTYTSGTVNANTSTINLVDGPGNGYVFNGGGRTYYNLNVAGWSAAFGSPSRVNINGANTFNNVSSSAAEPISLVLQAGLTQTVTNWTFDGLSASSLNALKSSVLGARATISKSSGTVTVNNTVIQDSNATGGATFNAFGASVDNGNNLGWNFANPGARYWVGGTDTWNGIAGTKWALTSGGAGGAAIPGANNDVFFNSSSGSGTIQIGFPSETYGPNANNFSTSGFTGSFNGGFDGYLSVGGNCEITSSISGSLFRSFLTLRSVSTGLNQNLTTSGKTIVGLFCNPDPTATAVVTLQDDLTVSQSVSVQGGTFTANDKNISCANFVLANSTTTNMGSGTWTATNNSFVNQGSVINAATSNIVFSGSVNATFTGGARTYYNFSVTGTTSLVTINSFNTVFNTISSRPVPAGIVTYSFSDGSTTTVTTFNIKGSASFRAIVQGAGTTANSIINSAGGVVQSGLDYLDFRNITAAPTPNATGTTPYLWYIGSNSVKNARTTGVVMSSDVSDKYFNLLSGTSWTVPADWNSSDNNIFLFGGGGGGGSTVIASSTGTRVAGSGGGGGGFTNLLNASLTPGGSVSYAVGAAGSVGATSTSASTSGNGGTTTFNVTNTAGGGGGAASTLSATTIGAAGVGTTNNGGAGGNGGGPKGNVNWAGAGGGGSGGPSGAGLAGGNSTTSVAGLGGAGNNGAQTTPIFGDGGNGSTATGSAGFGFGAGGAGSGVGASSTFGRTGGLGTQGAILIRYRVGAVSTATGNFLTFFYQ